MNNRIYNCKNPAQGKFKKVLCVCSAGLLRSPTIAEVLSQEPYNFNTRSCGWDHSFALIPIDDVLVEWADEIVVVDDYVANQLKKKTTKPIIYLNIDDTYEFRDRKLIKIIKENYEKYYKETEK